MSGGFLAICWTMALLMNQLGLGCLPPPRRPTTSVASTTPAAVSTTSTTTEAATTTTTGADSCNASVTAEASYNPGVWPASHVLTEGQDSSSDGFNYWLSKHRGGFFIVDLGCVKAFSGVRLINTHNSYAKDRATKAFRLSGGLNLEDGSFLILVEDSLADSRLLDPVPEENFSFPEIELRFVRFEVLNFWGSGGGLQFIELSASGDAAGSGGSTTGSGGTTTAGGSTTPGGSTTASPSLEWQSAATSVDIGTGDTSSICKVNFQFALDKGVVLKNVDAASCTGGSLSATTIKYAGQHVFEISSSEGLNFDCSMTAALVDGALNEDVVNKTIKCSAKDDQCITDGGQVYPSMCTFPFIYDGNLFKACTDVGSPDSNRLWCATQVDESGVAVEGKAGLCNSKCGYCGGSPVSRRDGSKPCGYNCLVNPDKAMTPLTIMDPDLLTPPSVSENPSKPLLPFNTKPGSMFQFNIGDPGVFLYCENGFNHFPCKKNLFVNCTGEYRFTAYEVICPVNSVIGEKIKDTVENSHIGCGPCPLGFNYLKGYESRTYSTSLGGYYNVPTINDCRTKCDELGCFTFAYSPTSRSCKLHSVRRVTLSKPVYKDYRMCVKEESNACITGLRSKHVRASPSHPTYQCINDKIGKYYWTTKCDKNAGNAELQTDILFYPLKVASAETGHWANRCNKRIYDKNPRPLDQSAAKWNKPETRSLSEGLAKASIKLLDFISHEGTKADAIVLCPAMIMQTISIALVEKKENSVTTIQIVIAGNLNKPFRDVQNKKMIETIVKAELGELVSNNIFLLYPDARTFGNGKSSHHAEMQIVKYIDESRSTRTMLHLGVSKPPCCNCNTVLRRVESDVSTDMSNVYEAGLPPGTRNTDIPELLENVPVASGKGSDKCKNIATKKEEWCGSQYTGTILPTGLPDTSAWMHPKAWTSQNKPEPTRPFMKKLVVKGGKYELE